jgi:hypothetical protein
MITLQVSNLVEDAQAGKALKGPNSSSATTPLSPTTAHAIFASTVGGPRRRATTGITSTLKLRPLVRSIKLHHRAFLNVFLLLSATASSNVTLQHNS